VRILHVQGDQPDHCRGRQPDRGGQPVHPVQQVQGVDTADQPDHGQQRSQPTQFDRIAERDNPVNVTAEEYDRQHGHDLQEKLYASLQVISVVDRSDQADEPTDHDHQERKLIKGRPDAKGAEVSCRQTEEGGRIDRHTAP